jgi:hypothetical protein
MDAVVTQPGDLISTRLFLLRNLADSLEISQLALSANDAEKIARGAAHQAELCRQWSLLEDQLRRESDRGSLSLVDTPARPSQPLSPSTDHNREFEALTIRIRHLTRVHCSLLRHLQRSLAILAHRAEAHAPTYAPELNLLHIATQPQAGAQSCPD